MLVLAVQIEQPLAELGELGGLHRNAADEAGGAAAAANGTAQNHAVLLQRQFVFGQPRTQVVGIVIEPHHGADLGAVGPGADLGRATAGTQQQAESADDN